jgi:hypothetical protein
VACTVTALTRAKELEFVKEAIRLQDGQLIAFLAQRWLTEKKKLPQQFHLSYNHSHR